jgi:hypothetical protein
MAEHWNFLDRGSLLKIPLVLVILKMALPKRIKVYQNGIILGNGVIELFIASFEICVVH